MNRFMKVIGLMAGLLGLGVAGAELSTVTWDARAGVVAGALADAAVDIIAPAPLAAQNGNGNGGGEQQCNFCEERVERKFLYYHNGVPVYMEWTEHKLEGECGDVGGGGPDLALRWGTAHVQYAGLASLDEEECVACGNQSICGHDWEVGYCHEACPHGGGSSSMASVEDTHRALVARDVDAIVALVTESQNVTYDSSRAALITLSACNPTRVVGVTPVPVQIAMRVEALIGERM